METRHRRIMYLGTPLFVAVVLITALLIATRGSGPAMSGGFLIPSACGSPASCLSLARQAGFHGHVLTPAAHVVSEDTNNYFYPQQGHLSMGVALGYREGRSSQAFEETIAQRPDLPDLCPLHPPLFQPMTTPHGRPVCLMSGDHTLVFFDSSGVHYQVTTLAGVPPASQATFLLRAVDQLG